MNKPANQRRTPVRYLTTFTAYAIALNILLQILQTVTELLKHLGR